jgi:hypothetical protein
MNWGNRLLLVFVVFALGISTLVYLCMTTPVDLVSNDYYKDELAYQQVIDAVKRTNSLTGSVVLREKGQKISLQLPEEMKHASVDGTVSFYCPSDMARDKRMALAPDGEAHQDIDAGSIEPGRYSVRIRWTSGGVLYFSEQSINIQ